MNTIIEFAIYTIVGLALVAVPLALIAGGFASRSVNYSGDASDRFTQNSTQKGK